MSQYESKFRLPVDVKPIHYDVTIKTDLEYQTFEGVVKVSLDVKKDTSEIVLNSAESLALGKVSIYSDALKMEQSPVASAFDKAQERTKYSVAHTLPAGSKAEVKIGFNGQLTGGIMGYYNSSWEHEGKTKYYALTQFEPTAARRAFPCWDEPQLKATFTISLVSRADTVNLSNMSVKSETAYEKGSSVSKHLEEYISLPKTSDEPWKITTFETTPPMSTYIVAFANGHFKFIEKSVVLPVSGKTVPLRVYATEDVIHQAQFALDVKASVLPLYEKVFDVGYPLPKLDTLVASDFDAGAMENWGLITGRTSAFLLDPKSADLTAKKGIFFTQSHEVAHMWFGNITTMEWWDYLYLNEGFATLMGEVIIADKKVLIIFPEWKVNTDFILAHLNSAMNLDAKLSSHPIEVKCPDANFINQIFDALSYSKAASVLRMLSRYVGEDLFLKGVSIYLKKKLYGNSVTNDLWDGISHATGKDISRLMDNWISKIGFPVLTVTETSEGINVRQDRFLETGLAEPADNETIWNIPLSLLSVGSNGKVSIDNSAILEERTKFFPLATDKPFKLNAGTTGIYRVLYTPERLAKIAEEATKENSAFALGDRIGLVTDAFALSKAGLSNLSSALTLVDILRNEKEYLVWDSFANRLSDIASIWWEHQDIIDQLNVFRRALFVPLVEKLGYEYSTSDSPDTTELRTLAIAQSAEAKDKSVVSELKSRFAYFIDTGDDSKIPADLQRAIFKTAVREGGKKEFNAVVGIHDKPKTPTARIAAMIAMGNTQDSELINEVLKFIKTKSKDQDVPYFFRGLSSNNKARRTIAKFFMDEYDYLYKRFENNFMLQRLVKIPFGTLATEKDLKSLQAFFKDKDTSKFNLALSQTEDTIKAKIAYLQHSTKDLSGWLGEWQKKQPKL